MDEQELNQILSRLQAPEPAKDAQNQALASALAVFDKKPQGSAQTRRLTDITFINNVRRLFMQKKYVLSGMAGTVSLLALLAVLGQPYMQGEMSRLQGDISYSVAKQKAAPPASRLNMATGQIAADKRAEADYKARAKEQEADTVALAPAKNEEVKVLREMADMAAPSQAPVAEKAAGNTLAMPVAPSAPVVTGGMKKDTLSFAIGMPAEEQMQQPGYQDVGRDKFTHVDENPVKTVAAEPVSTFSIDVDTSSYSFMRRMITQGVLPQKDAVRPEEMINYFDYHYPLADSREQPFRPSIAVFDAPWKPGDKLVHIGIKGYDIASAEKPRSNLVFLIDVSGSMNSPDKLPLLKNSLKLLLESLQPEDTVGIVVYAGNAGTVLEPTKVSDKQKIVSALESLTPGGSTAGAEGIRQAYNLARQNLAKDGVNRVILATDGDFNVGITDQNELKSFIERERESGVFLSVLGFGEGNYNDSMMQTLAQNGNGVAAYIDTLSEARKVLVQEASSTLFTIAKDVKIQVEFNPALVKEYRLIGYETRHLNREDFNNDKVDAGDIGSGHAVTAIYEITPAAGGKPLLDDLRYGAAKPAAEPEKNGEYAFLKIRYKLPKEDQSRLITRPITPTDEVAFDKAPDDARFATAVAGFAELLKGGKHSGALTYDDVIRIADSARGKDEFGYRAEFINLVRLAKSAAAMAPANR